MVETALYEKYASKKVRCLICQRRCLISEGKLGFCGTRLNKEGKLFSLIFGEVSTYHIAPIEIKPLFHFYPGTRAASFGSVGCNFHCPGCQNWEIAHARVGEVETQYISPQEAIQIAFQDRCQGLSWTYNEPTLWLEYTLESAKLAKERGLYTSYVTNGFITPEALDLIGPYLDAFRVDIKGFTRQFYRRIAGVEDFRGILKVTRRAKEKWNMHVEVVTNIIPGYNDEEKQMHSLAIWIRENLGGDTPWHITSFFPHLKLAHLPPTPVSTLEKVLKWGEEEGLRFVYLGNVPGHPRENTYCPECGSLLIKRMNYRILEYNIKRGKCKFCMKEIPIINGSQKNSGYPETFS